MMGTWVAPVPMLAVWSSLGGPTSLTLFAMAAAGYKLAKVTTMMTAMTAMTRATRKLTRAHARAHSSVRAHTRHLLTTNAPSPPSLSFASPGKAKALLIAERQLGLVDETGRRIDEETMGYMEG